METLKDIFDNYDNDEDGKIDCISFKLIVNLIGLQIIDCTNKYYEYSDLIDYIKKYGTLKKPISKNKIRQIVKKNYKKNLQFVISDLTP